MHCVVWIEWNICSSLKLPNLKFSLGWCCAFFWLFSFSIDTMESQIMQRNETNQNWFRTKLKKIWANQKVSLREWQTRKWVEWNDGSDALIFRGYWLSLLEFVQHCTHAFQIQMDYSTNVIPFWSILLLLLLLLSQSFSASSLSCCLIHCSSKTDEKRKQKIETLPSSSQALLMHCHWKFIYSNVFDRSAARSVHKWANQITK